MTDHGYGRYSHGCRCAVCTQAKREYMAGRRAGGLEHDPRAHHDATYVPRVDYAAVRAHVQQLVAHGWTLKWIAVAAGVHITSVRTIFTGGRCHTKTAAKILAVPLRQYGSTTQGVVA